MLLPFPDMADELVSRDAVPAVVQGRSEKSPMKVGYDLVSALGERDRVLFLDVETTGLSWFYDELTVIGWAVAGTYNVMVAGQDSLPLRQALERAHAIVTFNGTLFDLRFLRKAFGDLKLPPIHIDLRYLSRRAGLTGGQKAIEVALNLEVRDGVKDIAGAEAVILWHRHLRGDPKALGRLVDYNRRDVLGMCCILDSVVERLVIQPDLWLALPRFGEDATAMLRQPMPVLPGPVERAARRSMTFEELFCSTPAHRAIIVGIDLTGSAARPTGWCVLRGDTAFTRTVSTDDEIFEQTMAEKPSLVSIDSPLSLPLGRIQVEDTDPGRAQYGIMRLCERELKRRGINVYPCLLPSMQGLTRRGMTLAARFRAAGIPVIESYPGAAQDIMGIPRKGAGVEFLKQGLSDFGIKGAFRHVAISHDELDAITSAVVGSFFLADRFEALSGPSEEALIIPQPDRVAAGTVVIGISGKICAGKTTAARELERLGLAYTRFSLVIDDELAARGEPSNRETRQWLGDELHREKGQRWLCEKVLARVGEAGLIVVDGLRFPEDHAFFSERFGPRFFHMHIDAATRVRSARYALMDDAPVSFDQADRQPVEARIDDLSQLAATHIDNNDGMAEFLAIVLQHVSDFGIQSAQCLSQSS